MERETLDTGPLILHVDADAFFASVEQALNPALKGKAVVVGGSNRGVVSAASYEARRYGVHSAMPIYRARRLCPHAVFIKPSFGRYRRFSDNMFEIMERYSPLVEATSVDEGYVDLTGTLKLHGGSPWGVAARLLDEIRSTLDINVSGGLACSKIAAKMATGLAKPNGLIYLEPRYTWTVLGTLPVGAVPGVGARAQRILAEHGVTKTGQIAEASREEMKRILGRHGEKLWDIVTGRHASRVRGEPREQRKSYSHERTLEENTLDYAFIRKTARTLAERLTAKVRRDGVGACAVTFKVRYADFTDCSASMTLRRPTDSDRVVLSCVDALIRKTIRRRAPIRQVGVKLSGIDEPANQLELFRSGTLDDSRRDAAVDRIRSRFGFDAVRVSADENRSTERRGSLAAEKERSKVRDSSFDSVSTIGTGTEN